MSDGFLNQINFADLQPCQTNVIKHNKNVTTYCYSERYDEKINPYGNEAFILCVCIKSKYLQLYTIENGEINFYKEIVLPELCLQMEINKNYICIASDNSYLIVNMFNSNIQTLFSYDIENLRPFIANYIEGEFLLNCQGDLGMFASFDGQSTRPPFPWCNNCTRFQIFNPYVLCSSGDNHIKIYNLTDLKLKQEIVLSNIKQLEYFGEERFLILATPTQIFILNRTSMLFQVDQLLIKNQVDEAINLFEVLSINLNKSDYSEQIKKIKIKSGFIELIENSNYNKCETLFLEANLDYREIIKFLPNYKIKSNALPPPEDYIEKYRAYFSDVKKLNKSKVSSVKKMLINVMLKSKKFAKDDEYISILLQLCIDCDDELLNKFEFFSNLPLNLCVKNVQILNEHKRYHSVALIYYLVDQYESVFFHSLCDKKLVDSNFPGFDFIVEQLAKCKDHQLVWKYVDWSMQVNQAKAVEIFTKRSADELTSERMRIDTVLENIQSYKEALTVYLEYLIHTKNIKKDKYNGQLISIYLENIIELLNISAEKRDPDWYNRLEKARTKFQTIIESPISFRVQTILVRIKEYENDLQKECAILYGRIEEHEKALKILVYTLHDYKSAINYCLNNSRDSVKTRKQLFNTLFSIYTNPSYSDSESLIKPTTELLNSKLIVYFDMPKMLEMIPNKWSMKLAGGFLQNALNTNLAKKRNCSVEKNISLNYKFELQTVLLELKKEQLYVDEDCKCFKCHKPLESSVFMRYPNGKLSHTLCKNENRNKIY